MSWVLEKRQPQGFWIYEKRRQWWRKLLRLPAAYPTLAGITPGASYRIFWIEYTWYDDENRTFDTTIEERHTFESTLAEGYAIYDWRNKKMVYP